jgi:AraC family transcriptional regulator of adaptative response/methylated-DNA-[protein]-cysteine methyltransferase
VTFYPSAAAAELAGFRPCLRCRPEAAPFSPAWMGTRTTVERAFRLIADGALDEGNVEALADRLGIGSRHLSRLFQRHLGASPVQVAQTTRVQRAKRLLDETDLTMSEIAVYAGFGSLRRFNAAFAEVYRRPPTEIRRARNPSVRNVGSWWMPTDRELDLNRNSYRNCLSLGNQIPLSRANFCDAQRACESSARFCHAVLPTGTESGWGQADRRVAGWYPGMKCEGCRQS